MIVSFGNKATSDLYHGVLNARVRRFPATIIETALYKLDLLNAAQFLDDLKSPPGNRLEPLRGNFKGFHSIRINGQWRIIFRWHSFSANEVEIIDYH